ncbi:Translation machinery-associated protein 46 [Coemansia biformis]|uniref:Translation machinery-associated protein 46 n=1 Tax=Coemansia biformis TaxID=1286918 RepID=A0A9W7YGD1_9FUNG|nr:Translation machinery-associated protein 46 [Coemansia biformis]
MPPKKTQPTKKSDDKQKKKIIEDKTFGLKNKNKSAKVAQYVKQVEKQVMDSGNRKALKDANDRKATQAEKREAERKKQEEFADLFKPVQLVQKVPFGVDPKSVLCINFKAGHCEKGAKCKFSHDPNVGRKGTKVDLYTDKRDQQTDDTMDKWDQNRLEEVVLSKHGNPQTTTDIVCKFFLEAIEGGKYGWFWECPNGGDKCKYKHALPPGFVLKRERTKEEKEEISLEEFLETERHKLGTNLTPVTLDSFAKWKEARQERREAESLKTQQAKEKAYKAGKLANMSGRDFFEFNPELDADEGDDDSFDFAQYRNADGGYQQDAEYDNADASAAGDAATEAVTEAIGELDIGAGN